MLKELFGGEYKPTFQYLIEDTLKYDRETISLMGNYEFKNSDYLVAPDKIVNVEDAIFVFDQAIYVLLSLHQQQITGMDFVHFRKNLFQNVILKGLSFEYNNFIQKEKDENDFMITMTSAKADSKNRLWFDCALSMSKDKFKANCSGCILDENPHKDQQILG